MAMLETLKYVPIIPLSSLTEKLAGGAAELGAMGQWRAIRDCFRQAGKQAG